MNLPLAEKLRPKSFEEIVGHDHLLSQDGFFRNSIERKKPLSFLLYGPPGCGKTTLARIYARSFSLPLITISAIFSGIAEIKKIVQDAKENPLFQRQLILFVDEIHRFNKAQQDAFLPLIEDGTLILIGATTENPSFSLNNALLSRLRILTLSSLNEVELHKILSRYEEKNSPLSLTPNAKNFLIASSHGDARHLLNMIENIEGKPGTLDVKDIEKLIQKKAALYDKQDEHHYNLISVLHKSIRSSDVDAALYWLARMLEGGEDPLFIARRLIRMASEDVGLADPNALQIAHFSWQTYHLLGSPEGELAIAEAVVYLALAPKSNALYVAMDSAREWAKKTSHLSPPKFALNAPTSLMKEMGYSDGYQYDHDTKEGCSGQNYFPESLTRTSFYSPVERGFERELKKRLEYFSSLRKKASDFSPS
jgi:putative ATPase